MEFIFNTNFHFFVVAYLIGGIPFGLLLIKKSAAVYTQNISLKEMDSQKILLVLKRKNQNLYKRLLFTSFLLDAMKGTVVLLIAMLLGLSTATLWGIAVLIVISHALSPYLNFEGAKGIESALGVMIVLLPMETIITLIIFMILKYIINTPFIPHLISFSIFTISSFVIHPDLPHAPILIITFFIFYKNISNIKQLIRRKI